MFFKIEGINNIEESNDFLINFSEKLREVFGKCSWAYFPAKNGPKQEITLGKIKINSSPIIYILMKPVQERWLLSLPKKSN